jgi:Uma2 family endonuclease
VEVAETSLESDRAVKLPLYAAAGIAEVWLVNLLDEVIEVHREPWNGAYTVRRIVRRGETVTPLHLPGVALAADEILGDPAADS